MRGVRLLDAHVMEVVDLPDPEPGPGEVVVRVHSCGICGSDLSSYKVGLFTDAVPGHEFSGTVASAGPGVQGWSADDRTVVDPKMPCGVCEDCLAGAAWRCSIALTAGLGFARDGGFAEFVLAPANLLHRLPDGLGLAEACLVEPLSIAIHGAGRAGRDGEPAVVVGLGPIGLFTIAVLRAGGTVQIIGVDPVADRRTLALELGASNVVATAAEVRAAAPPAPVVYECSGAGAVLHTAADLVAPGGVMVMLGVPFGEATVAPLMWVTREINIVGSIASSEHDFQRSIDMLAADPSLARIVTRRVGLDEVPRVFEELLEPAGGGKVVVDPSAV